MAIFGQKYDKISFPRNSSSRPCTTPPLTPISQSFETTTIDPNAVKDSNPRPCTTPPLTLKVKDSNPRHALHHYWPPQSQRFEPTTIMHYTTIDEPEKAKIRTQDHALCSTTIENLQVTHK
jgi:hypothetical protein